MVVEESNDREESPGQICAWPTVPPVSPLSPTATSAVPSPLKPPVVSEVIVVGTKTAGGL
jgi:hypothetical protein